MQLSQNDMTRQLLLQWRSDESATYRNWFLWQERIKNFRSIRRGISEVVAEIKAGSFGVTYRGSSLETVVKSIAEQRQMFKGADHAFLWKPKLRIPDIYENSQNQLAFAQLLNNCMCCNTAEAVVSHIRDIDKLKIKGLGPAVANLLYFLHPTIIPPFNTAIVKGYNLLKQANVKLGSWDQFLAMREGILALNETYRESLSNDLGAIGGFLYDIGTGKLPAPAETTGGAEEWQARLQKAKAEAAILSKARQVDIETERSHSEIQSWLRDLGSALGFDVWIATNDRGRIFDGKPLGDGCIDMWPDHVSSRNYSDAVRLIDVLWFEKSSTNIAAAFEVEHSTSIYSGIVRMLDLVMIDLQHGPTANLYLVAPDGREDDVRKQISRPAFSTISKLDICYLPYSEIAKHREQIARFGSGLKAIRAIARKL